jgi:hypothetical protein
MKLPLQTVATVFANRLGDNNRRVLPAPDASPLADLDLTGAILRVTMDQHLTTQFTITESEDLNLSRATLAENYGDPAVQAIKTQFGVAAKDIIVSALLPIENENQAIATSNGMSVRVSAEMLGKDIRYTLEVLLGTFSI